MIPTENRAIAEKLREAADLLQAQGANPFRVNAYRKAADTLAHLDTPMRALFDDKGREGLESLPGIGRGLASSIAEMLITGRWAQLERLRGEIDPEKLFQAVPGIGPDLAREIHEILQIETLEALELACTNGRLATVRGIVRAARPRSAPPSRRCSTAARDPETPVCVAAAARAARGAPPRDRPRIPREGRCR